MSPKSVPHPTRAEIYTMGECIPLPAPAGTPAGAVQSRVVLYHGSFVNLARLDPDFDWRTEAWETLTHELRHHVEWRAHAPALEAYDRAVEQNFARQEGESFDPGFYLDGDSPVPGVYEVDGDYFIRVDVVHHTARRAPSGMAWGPVYPAPRPSRELHLAGIPHHRGGWSSRRTGELLLGDSGGSPGSPDLFALRSRSPTVVPVDRAVVGA